MEHLNLSDEKMANMKTPMILKMEAMMEKLEQYRVDQDNSRHAKYELAFRSRQKVENEKRDREMKRLAR